MELLKSIGGLLPFLLYLCQPKFSIRNQTSYALNIDEMKSVVQKNSQIQLMCTWSLLINFFSIVSNMRIFEVTVTAGLTNSTNK